jgi:hypothetical protein
MGKLYGEMTASQKEAHCRRSVRWFQLHPVQRAVVVARTKDYRHRLKLAVFSLLGEACVRCGFSDKRALQIDHVHGDGKQDRARFKTRACFLLSILRDSDALSKYQILCANCNWIKRAEEGEYK